MARRRRFACIDNSISVRFTGHVVFLDYNDNITYKYMKICFYTSVTSFIEMAKIAVLVALGCISFGFLKVVDTGTAFFWFFC